MKRLIYIIGICSLLISVSSHSERNRESKRSVEKRIMLKLNNVNFFDYEKWKVIEKKYFSLESRIARDKLAIEHFNAIYRDEVEAIAKQLELNKAVEVTVIGSVLGAGLLASPIVSSLTMNTSARLIGALNTQIALPLALMWPALELSPYTLGEHGPVSLIKDAAKSGRIKRGESFEDPYMAVYHEFAKIYLSVRQEHPDLCEKTITMINKMRLDESKNIPHYARYIETVAALPFGATPLYPNQDFLLDRLEGYSDTVADQMSSLINNFLFKNENMYLGKTYIENPYYFQGIPGSGKTYAAETIAAGFRAPFINIALDGADYNAIVGEEFSVRESRKRGRLIESMVATKPADDDIYSLNSVMFLDEFDRLLNADDYSSRQVLSFMLKLLAPDHRYFYSPYLGVKIKLPQLIILAGNYEINDEALKNRFIIMKFDGFDLEAKRNIVSRAILPKLLASTAMSIESLTEDDLAAIEQIILNNQEDLGLRSIEKDLHDYLIKKATQGKFFDLSLRRQ